MPPDPPPPGFAFYRGVVLVFAGILGPYFYYRFAYSVEGAYQHLVAILELLGALNVLLLGMVRFRRPWAPATPSVPAVAWHGGGSDETFDVAILVPCCSEPDEVIFNTVRAALALEHPLARRVRVCLCDDGGRPSRRAALAAIAPAERAIYVSRPKDPSVPRHGKAGNLNFCLRHVLFRDDVPDDRAVVIVFDCDMEAHADFLAHTLPHLATEPSVALVQTPQFFYNVAPAGDIFNHHNLFFYQVRVHVHGAWAMAHVHAHIGPP